MAERDLREAMTRIAGAQEGREEDPYARGTVPVSVLLQALGVRMDPALERPRAEREERLAGQPPSARLGRFRLGPELGRGGMGRVVEAYDPDLRRTVAIKMLLDPSRVSEQQLVRFVAEARITAQLDHPSTCPVHELGVSRDGQVFFAMKRVRGRSLRQVLDRLAAGDEEAARTFTLHRLLTAFVQVCQAVAYAHDRGVLHRDLKPENVMLGDYGEVLVMDWGVARLIGAGQGAEGGEEEPIDAPTPGATTAGTAVGTPGFMSPEQARGRIADLDARSDVWSLGAILYEILTLSRAYVGETPFAVMLRAAREAPIDPRERAPERRIPDEIAEVCLKAMAMDREERYPSAAELARAVEAFLDGSRRRERALRIVEEGRERVARAAELRGVAARLREEAEALLRDVPSWAPVERKRAGWAKEDEADRAALEADRLETEAIELFQSAFQFTPGLPEARDALSDLYRARMEEAERDRDVARIRRYETLCRTYGAERHAAFLKGDGAVTLLTDPPGAVVRLYRYAEVERRLLPRPEGVLGTTPIVRARLPMGSWLLAIHHPDREEVLYPVHISRLEHWDGVPPAVPSPSSSRSPGGGHSGRGRSTSPRGGSSPGAIPRRRRSRPAPGCGWTASSSTDSR